MSLIIVALVMGAVTGGVAQAYARPAAAFVPVMVVAAVLVAVGGFRRATGGEQR